MPPAETPTQWSVGKYVPVDKDCANRNTRSGQFVVCIGAESLSEEAPEKKDLGTFAVVREEEQAKEVATALVAGSIGPFTSSSVPRSQDFEFITLLIGVSKSVLCQVTSHWRKLTVEPSSRGSGDLELVDRVGQTVHLALMVQDENGESVVKRVEAKVGTLMSFPER